MKRRPHGAGGYLNNEGAMFLKPTTVHIGARVAARAKPGEVFVSSTVKEAMAGSEFEFLNRGAHKLKGIPGEWCLFAAES